MKRILCAFLALLLCMLCACGVAEADRLQIKPSESTTESTGAEATVCVHEYDRPECADDRLCVRCGERAEPVKVHDMTQGDCVSPAVCKRCGYVGETAEHVFTGGDCVTPAVCEVCGTEGETTEHRFSERTCTEAGVCAVCGETVEALGHDMREATCTEPAKCSRCGATEGEPLGHTGSGTCDRCGVRLETQTESSSSAGMVWIPQSGSRYHRYASCSGMNNPTQVTREEAEAMGYTPCKRCYK